MGFHENETFSGRYKLIKKLGIGGFAEVWLAEDQLTDNSQVAIKIYAPNSGLDNQGVKIFSKEYSLLQDLNNQFLLKALHFDVKDDKPYLVMPFCPHGSLLNKLHDDGAFTETELAKVMLHVGSALAYLHNNGIIHQDIKPANILINRNHEYVVSDFGISNNMRKTLRKSMNVASTSMSPEYAPPERFSSRSVSLPAGDVFSFGVLLYEMATGDVPWMGMGGMSLSRGAEIPELPAHFSNNFGQWIAACMSLEPSCRPTAKEIVKAADTFIEEGYWPRFQPSEEQAPVVPQDENHGRKTQRNIDLGKLGEEADKAFRNTATEPQAINSDNEKQGSRKPVFVSLVVALLVLSGGAFTWWLGILNDGDTESKVSSLSSPVEIYTLKADSFMKVKEYASAVVYYEKALGMAEGLMHSLLTVKLEKGKELLAKEESSLKLLKDDSNSNPNPKPRKNNSNNKKNEANIDDWPIEDKQIFIENCVANSIGKVEFDVRKYCTCMQLEVESSYRIDELNQITRNEMSKLANKCLGEL